MLSLQLIAGDFNIRAQSSDGLGDRRPDELFAVGPRRSVNCINCAV